jgi:hypothetical protein
MICVLTGLQQVILESQSVMNAVDGATIERRIRINRPGDENTRCRVSRVRVQPKDFSQRTQPLTTLSTSNAISPQQERTEPSGPRRRRRGAKSSLREPNMPAYLLRALFGNVTVPGALIRKIEKTKIGCFHYHKRLKNGAGILCRVDVFSSNIHGDAAVLAGACVKLPPASIINKSLSLTSF